MILLQTLSKIYLHLTLSLPRLPTVIRKGGIYLTMNLLRFSIFLCFNLNYFNSNNDRMFYENVDDRNLSDFTKNKMNIVESAFHLAKANNLIKSHLPKEIDSSSSTASTSLNPLSILSVVSMLNGNNNLNSASDILSSLTSLITLLPLNQYFLRMNQQTSSSLIAALPQFVKLIETVSNFQSLVSHIISMN